MGRHIVHRILILLPALIGVLFLCFCLLQVVPSDPAQIIAGPPYCAVRLDRTILGHHLRL